MTYLIKWFPTLFILILVQIFLCVLPSKPSATNFWLAHAVFLTYNFFILLWAIKSKVKIDKKELALIFATSLILLIPVPFVFSEVMVQIAKAYPSISPIVALYYSGSLGIFLGGFLVLLMMGMVLSRFIVEAKVMHKDLISKGYYWITHYQTYKRNTKIGELVYRLPAYEELAVIPGIGQNNIDGLVTIARLFPERLKKTRIVDDDGYFLFLGW